MCENNKKTNEVISNLRFGLDKINNQCVKILGEVFNVSFKINKKGNNITITHGAMNNDYSYEFGSRICDYIEERLDTFCDLEYTPFDVVISIF